MTGRWSWLRAALGGLFISALAFTGCSHDDAGKAAALGGLSNGCLVNSDCSAPLVCAFQRCHAECVTTRDCDGTLRCVGAHEQAHVCQLESESTCTTTADCAPGLVCSGDGACRDVCANDAECVGTQLCTQGVCAEPAELDEAGNLPQTLAQATCRLNSDCPTGSRCVQATCLPECVSERDCGLAEQCQDGACVTSVSLPCQTDDACSTPGQSCVAGSCRCACREDVDCAAGETCDGCACLPPPPPRCVDAQDCQAEQRCVDGACVCSCVEDRDCPAASLCNGCGCEPRPAVTVIHDAAILDAGDLALMRGITEVETTLTLAGAEVLSTDGLESLEVVGRLELRSLNFSSQPDAPYPLSGLLGLKLIRGDLNISGMANLKTLQLNPALQVGGNVMISSTQLSCMTIYAFEQSLRANGFQGTVTGSYNDNCPGPCSKGMCYPPS